MNHSRALEPLNDFTISDAANFGGNVINNSEIEQEVLKQMNDQYPSNNFTLESIELCGDKYYDTDKGILFTGEAVAKITQIVPYGQEPQGDWFTISNND